MNDTVRCHPVHKLRRLGAGDGPVVVATTLVLALQCAMLVAIFRRFILAAPNAGLEIAESGAWATALAVVTASVFGSIGSLIVREIRRTRLRRQAEVLDLLPSIAPVPDQLRAWEAVSGRRSQVDVAYHLQFADACYTTVSDGIQRIVLSKGFGKLWRSDPSTAALMLAHEYSHVEIGATTGERQARIALKAYFLLVIGLLAAILLTLAYFEPAVERGRSVASLDFIALAEKPRYWPNPSSDLLLKVVAPFILVGIAAGAVFVFSYFHLVRRELYHDLRAVQLTGLREAAVALHTRSPNGSAPQHRRWVAAIHAFFRLHPSPSKRAACVAAEDPQLIDSSIYPLLVGALLPSSLLALDFLNPFSDSRAVLWKIPETAIIGLLIMLAIRADSVRFALLDQRRTRKLLLISRYAAMMGLGSAFAGSLLIVWFWYRFDHDTSWLSRNAELQLFIGLRTSAYFGILLLGLSWAAWVRIMRRQLGSTGLGRAETIVFAIVGVLGFMLLSVRDSVFVGPLLGVLVVVAAGWVALLFLRKLERTSSRQT